MAVQFPVSKGKPVARRGRKATGLFHEPAGLPGVGLDRRTRIVVAPVFSAVDEGVLR